MKLVKEIGKKERRAEEKLELIKSFDNKFSDLKALLEILSSSEDEELYSELTSELKTLETRLEDLKLETLLNGKYDSLNAI